ncbi:MAG: DUF2007 domain-containing protein [Bacteroidia bacterium]|nr:DUF2007 domain-containing protein [Bacteroidia bacterium]
MHHSSFRWITVASFNAPHDAYIMKAYLESEGIECFLKDELTVQVNIFYSNAIGGVKLQVREEDVEKAKDVLREGGYAV